MSYYLQEDGVSKFLLEDLSGAYLLETGGAAYTDSVTISTTTSISASDVFAAIDSGVVIGKTTPSGVEFASHIYIDSAIISSKTTLTGSYITETFTIRTTDYSWNPWSTAYTFDGSIPVYGSVGAFDDDTGILV